MGRTITTCNFSRSVNSARCLPLHHTPILRVQVIWHAGILFILGIALLFSCVVAVAQWWTLRRRLPNSRRWGIMTAIGALAAQVAYAVSTGSISINDAAIFPNTTGVVAGALFGLPLGVLQSRALETPFSGRHRTQWTGASVLAGGAASAISRAVGAFDFAGISFGASYSPLPWILYALITGVAMYWLIAWGQRSQWIIPFD